MFDAGDIKWGQAVLGTSSGPVQWSADFVNALPKATGSNAQFDAALELAFDTWESVASIDFVRVNSGGDINVVTGEAGGSAVGSAFTTFDGNPGLSSINSSIITFDDDQSWAPFGSGGLDFFAVALHEIGHAIGLDHVNDVTQIMNPFISTDQLGDGDISGAQFLYGRDVEDEPAPEDNPRVGADDGGGGGGIVLGLLGILALIFGGLFTGGGAVAALAAGHVREDDEDTPTIEGDESILLTDLLPSLPVPDEHSIHYLFLNEEDAEEHEHDHEEFLM